MVKAVWRRCRPSRALLMMLLMLLLLLLMLLMLLLLLLSSTSNDLAASNMPINSPAPPVPPISTITRCITVHLKVE